MPCSMFRCIQASSEDQPPGDEDPDNDIPESVQQESKKPLLVKI